MSSITMICKKMQKVLSNFFDYDSIKYFSDKVNSEIASCTDPFNMMYQTSDEVKSILVDKKNQQYQSKLIANQVNNCDEYILDVDKLHFSIKLTNKDYCQFESEIEKVKTKKKSEMLEVTKSKNVKSKSSSCMDNKLSSYYAYKYTVTVGGDRYKSVHMYVFFNSDGSKSIEFNLIPTRFSGYQMKLVFNHLKSVLGSRRYKQLINNALFSRVDVGMNLYGISPLFFIAFTTDNRYSNGRSYPEGLGVVKESIYIGDIGGNTIIIYDKGLKEFKLLVSAGKPQFNGCSLHEMKSELKWMQDIYRRMSQTVRIEERFKFKNPCALSKVIKKSLSLSKISVINPKYLNMLDSSSIESLLTEKGQTANKNISSILRNTLKSKGLETELGSDVELRFCPVKLNKAYRASFEDTWSLIENPDIKNEFKTNFINHSAVSQMIRERLEHTSDKYKSNYIDINSVNFEKWKIVYIQAGAGAGKTRAISDIVKRIPENDQCKARVITFTKASKNEIAERIKECNEVKVTTFSAWALEELQYKNLLNKSVIDPAEMQEIIDGLMKKYPPNINGGGDLNGLAVVKVINTTRAFRYDSIAQAIPKINKKLKNYSGYIKFIYDKYESLKEKSHRQDFDGLLESFYLELSDKSFLDSVSKNLEYLLVDEVQDLNKLQWEILGVLSNNGVMIITVGDPAQSIYQFRGAFPEYIEKMISVKYTARINHRSTQEICDVSNFLRSEIDRKYLGSKSVLGHGELPRLIDIEDVDDAIAWMVKDILCSSKKHKTLIVCRHNSHVSKVNSLLKEKCIDQERVKCIKSSTIHMAKGLEAYAVYVLDPRYGYVGYGNSTEELCNLYVAVSRAKKRLTIIRRLNVKNSRRRKYNILDELDENYCELLQN